MANFFGGFFKQAEKPQSDHPPSAMQAFSQYDSEYIKYCIEQEQTISKLETCLHTTDDPKEIAMKTLKTACDFYGADWASVVDLDVSLGVWSHGWWHNPDPNITTIQYADEFENLRPMTSWIEALKKSEPIIVLDVNDPSVSVDERRVYEKLHAQSVMAFPYGPNPLGFFVLRNPTRYIGRISAMKTLAYVLHRALAQQKTIDRAKMALTPDDINSDTDVIVNLFGDMEICTSAGIWKEQDFKSPKCSRVVAYLLLQRKAAHSALGIADALYPEEDIDPETVNQNIRSYIYRFRRSLEPIFKYQLIEYTANGYRLNPNINVMTDLQKFDRLWEQSQKKLPVSQKTHILKRAIQLYRGTVFETACDDHWLVGIATEYKLKYIGLVNELLSILAKYDDYNGINTFAMQALKLTPENIKAYYWLIYAMYHSGTIELAKSEMQRAKSILTSEEYATLVKYLLQDESLSGSSLFAA